MTRAHKRLAVGCLLAGVCSFVAGHTLGAETRVLIVAGLGGEPGYEIQFQRHANASAKRLREVANDVTLLLGEMAGRDAVRSALIDINRRTAADDALVLMLIGHGSYDGEHFRFNVPGPDFTAVDLAGWLEPVAAKRQLVVVTGSASGAVQAPLVHAGRTVITATRSGQERNATVFARYFSEALGANAADVDKDQRITGQEAFSYASREVEGYYASQQEMATEHPLSEGPEAATVLARLESLPAFELFVTPGYARLEALEQDIAALRADKSSYAQADYYAELQRLLLELVVVESQLEEVTGEGNP
ncbi:MAG: hypothetical protein O7C67_15705 [Gammaproteobacteria bacterium]|nr:hypothetical protein [Gammaproteobacteria bacterium]